MYLMRKKTNTHKSCDTVCLMPKHLEGSWNLRDGFTNTGSWRFPISFLENHWQCVDLFRR